MFFFIKKHAVCFIRVKNTFLAKFASKYSLYQHNYTVCVVLFKILDGFYIRLTGITVYNLFQHETLQD